jgi:hypothetical protein
VQFDAWSLAPDEALLQAALIFRITEQVSGDLTRFPAESVRRPGLAAALPLVKPKAGTFS